jgi:hypothetical protein
MAELFYVIGGGVFVYALIGGIVALFESSQTDDPINWKWLYNWPRIIFGK